MEFEIVAGSYEEFLLGYVFSPTLNNLKPSFASHDHSASVRCVAVSGNIMASAAADDRIIIYDLKTRKEQGMLTHHDATINCLQITKGHSHIVSGSSDGVLSITRVGNWQVEKLWDKAHKGEPVLDIALHSSGKLALTLGGDCTLSTWNLVKGRKAYILNLNTLSKDAKSLEKIVWADDDVRFILYGGRYTEIWDINMGGILKIIEHHTRVTSCIWFSSDKILLGYEDGQLSLLKISNETRQNYKGHEGRIKALLKYEKYIISASSTGELKVWNEDIEELACVNTGCRLTCLSVIPGKHLKKEKIEEECNEIIDDSPKKQVQKSTVVIEIEDDDKYGLHVGNNEIIEKTHKKKRKRNKLHKEVNIQSDMNVTHENGKQATAKDTNKKKRRNNIEDSKSDTHSNQIEITDVKENKKKKRQIKTDTEVDGPNHGNFELVGETDKKKKNKRNCFSKETLNLKNKKKKSKTLKAL